MMSSDDPRHKLRTDQAFAELLGKAAPRPVPPAEDEAQIRDAVYTEWQMLAQRRRRKRHFTSFALAASVLLAVFATLNLLRDPVAPLESLQVAVIEKQFGQVSITAQNTNAVSSTISISGGDVVATEDGSGLALRWHDGGSLRIDENTVVAFEAEDQIYLQKGRVYFDSATKLLTAPANGVQLQTSRAKVVEFRIRTDSGVLRHLGTQYMTEITADGFIVSVRDGMVSVNGQTNARIAEGQQAAIDASGVLTIDETLGFGDEWQWIEKTTPSVKLNGRLISEALDWVSRESGRSVKYVSPAAKELAETDFIRGDYDAEPSVALNLFIQTVDLKVEILDGFIVVSKTDH